MAIVRFNPLNEVVGLQHEVNKIIDNFFPGKRVGGDEGFFSAVWRPVVDIHEDENSFIIDAELPGLTKEDVKISFQDDTLTVTGERRYAHDNQPQQAVQTEGEGEQPAAGAAQNRSSNVHRMERLYGKFTRSFTFPKAVSPDGIKATFENGILTISVPKAEAAKPRQIVIG